MNLEDMKIGELARRTGITVRTLHHYHEIGLLVPSFHSQGEHRSYSRADLARLQQIKSLQALGLTLNEIRKILDRPDHSPLETIEKHIERIDGEIEQGRRLRARLEHAARLLRSARELSTQDLIQTIEDTVMFEKYYTPEQLETLRARHEVVGEERIQEVQQEWAQLFKEFEVARDGGADPASEPVLALARRAQALIEEFVSGDAGIRDSLSELYRKEGGPKVMSQHGMNIAPGVWEYMNEAMQKLKNSE